MLTEAERELIKKNLLQVLESEEATPAERLEGSKLLLELDKAGGSYCNAYGVGERGGVMRLLHGTIITGLSMLCMSNI